MQLRTAFVLLTDCQSLCVLTPIRCWQHVTFLRWPAIAEHQMPRRYQDYWPTKPHSIFLPDRIIVCWLATCRIESKVSFPFRLIGDPFPVQVSNFVFVFVLCWLVERAQWHTFPFVGWNYKRVPGKYIGAFRNDSGMRNWGNNRPGCFWILSNQCAIKHCMKLCYMRRRSATQSQPNRTYKQHSMRA